MTVIEFVKSIVFIIKLPKTKLEKDIQLIKDRSQNIGLLLDPPDGKCPFQNIVRSNSFCGRKLLDGDRFCYWHSKNLNKYDQDVINKYFSKDVTLKHAIEMEINGGNSLEDAYLPKAQIGGHRFCQGANLSGGNLAGANLSGAKLSYCILKNAHLMFSNLESAFLSDSDIRGANFTNACLYNVKFRNNNFDDVKGLDKECFRGWKWNIIPVYHILKDYPEYNKPVYRCLKNYFSKMGAYDDASWAAYREYEEDRRLLKRKLSLIDFSINQSLLMIAKNQKINISAFIYQRLGEWLLTFFQVIKSYFFCYCFGHGEKPLRVLLICLFTITAYAFVFFKFEMLNESTFQNALYFSIVTFTTLGYGDQIAKKDFQLFAASEAIIGLILIGLLLFTLSRRGAGR